MLSSVHSTSPIHVPVANATACTAAALAVTIIDGPCAATNGSIALMEHAASPTASLLLLHVRSVAGRDDASRECALVAAAAAASRFHKRGLLRPPINAASLAEADAPTSSILLLDPQHKVYGRKLSRRPRATLRTTTSTPARGRLSSTRCNGQHLLFQTLSHSPFVRPYTL
jgi:hypothetical protein